MRTILLQWQARRLAGWHAGPGLLPKRKTRLLVIIALLLGTVQAWAQSNVTGTVADEKNVPLIGVSVKIKGTQSGTQTDVTGKFSINVTENTTLVVTYIGYAPKEVKVAPGDKITVQLSTANRSLDEVVVVGYGTQKKGDLTGAVATVKADNFVQGAARDAAELLRGKVAGLTVSSPSGDPTRGGEVYLRGINSLVGSQSPLVLIDGVPGDLRTVPPENIAQIDVLKDGSSAAIYGTRATNGVILITTKQPNGRSEVNYSGYVSTERFVKTDRFLTAAEFRQAIQNKTISATDYGGNTDWLKEVTRKPFTEVHDLSIKGGTDKTNFLADFNFRGYQGVFKKSNDRTIIGTLSINHNMLDGKLKLNLNYNTNNDRYDVTGDGYSFNNSIYNLAEISNPTLPVYKSQVSPSVLAANPAYNGPWAQQSAFIGLPNPLSLVETANGVNSSQKNRIYGSLNYMPVDFLKFTANGSTEKYNQTRGYAESFDNFNTTVAHSRNGYASRGATQASNRLFEFIAQFNKTFNNNHTVTALVGYGYQDNVTEDFFEQNWNFPTDQFSWNNIGLGRANNATAGQAIPIGSSKSSYNLISYFARLNYNYQDKYLLMASIRREGDSRFLGSNQVYGNFPAASVAWRINKESFLDDVKSIGQLKLRLGYGVTGISPIAPYLADYRLGYSGNGNTFYYNGQWVNLLQPQSNPNPAFTWEKKKEFNLGLDFAFLNNRINGSIDAYSRKISDLLYSYPVPVPPNLYPNTYANVGTIKNKGLEVVINTAQVQTKNFDWTSTFTFSTNSNKVGSFNNSAFSIGVNYFYVGSTQAPINTPTNIVQVGHPIGDIWGWKVEGIDDKGKWIYQGANGQPVSSVNAKPEDRRVLGNGIPKYFGGWNNNFRFRNIDLGVTMRGQFDYQIINFTRMHYENYRDNANNNLKAGYEPVLGKTVDLDNKQFNSYYVENGNFWKVDNITLGYNFKPNFIKGIRSARIYASTLNTFTFTKYKGLDPEIALLTGNGLAAGTDDRYKYPTTRVFTLGVNIGLQ